MGCELQKSVLQNLLECWGVTGPFSGFAGAAIWGEIYWQFFWAWNNANLFLTSASPRHARGKNFVALYWNVSFFIKICREFSCSIQGTQSHFTHISYVADYCILLYLQCFHLFPTNLELILCTSWHLILFSPEVHSWHWCKLKIQFTRLTILQPLFIPVD